MKRLLSLLWSCVLVVACFGAIFMLVSVTATMFVVAIFSLYQAAAESDAAYLESAAVAMALFAVAAYLLKLSALATRHIGENWNGENWN